MPKEREQSAIDAIYELLSEVKSLRKEVKIIDSNVKLLNNKVSKLSMTSGSINTSEPRAEVPPAPSAKVPEPAIKSDHQVKLFGRIKNQRKKPIKDVYIKIYNPRGDVVKARQTDNNGYWEARVDPGKYVVELDARHINKSFVPMNINIDVNETMNEFEVK